MDKERKERSGTISGLEPRQEKREEEWSGSTRYRKLEEATFPDFADRNEHEKEGKMGF